MGEHQIRRRWIKLWTQETLYGTTKVELLPDERGIWFLMLCKAGDSPMPGQICIEPNLSYTQEQLAVIFNVPIELYLRAEAKLIEHNKIHKNGTGIIQIVNWDKYQGFDRQGYQTDYMRSYRVKLTNKTNSKTLETKTNKPTNKGGSPVSLMRKTTDKTRQDIDKDKTLALGNNLIDKSIVNPKVVKYNTGNKEPPQENIFTLYEENIGLITPKLADDLKILEEEYPLMWFQEALKIALNHNVRNLEYIKTILLRWQRDGFKVDTRKGKQEQKPRQLKSVKDLE